MTKEAWRDTLRAVAAKSNPQLAKTLRQLAGEPEKTDVDRDQDEIAEWLGPAREPGEEG